MAQPVGRSPEDRVDSWKEIAAYLNRSVRTVHRWEQSAGLPGYRHGSQGSSVYAYKSELDAWLKSGAAADAVWRFLSARSGSQPLRIVPLASLGGVEMFPSFSPDGRQVAFSWDGADRANRDIYVLAIGSAKPRRLTWHPGNDNYPAWSPDGQWIAFRRLHQKQDGGGGCEVLVVPAIGGTERSITAQRQCGTNEYDLPPPRLAWTPDSHALVLLDKPSIGEPFALFLIPLAGGAKQRLTAPPAAYLGDTAPAFSPDGRTLAFLRQRDMADGSIYVMDLTANFTPASQPRQVTPEQHGGSPMWAAGGRDIVYSQSLALWRTRASGAPGPRMVSAMPPAWGFTMSRQGRRLAYHDYRPDPDIWRLELASGHARNAPVRLISSTRVGATPQYSPDGSRIAFRSDRSGVSEVSPDGRTIAFDSNSGGGFHIWLVNSSGGNPRKLTSGPGSNVVPSWSRDGQWIYFASNRGGEYETWKMPAAGGEAVQVTTGGGYGGFESPDGKFIYYPQTYGGTVLWRMPVKGGQAVRITGDVFYPHNIAVTEDGIYFVGKPESDGEHPLRLYRFATEQIETLWRIRSASWGLSVSPDHRELLFASWEMRGGDLWLIENFR